MRRVTESPIGQWFMTHLYVVNLWYYVVRISIIARIHYVFLVVMGTKTGRLPTYCVCFSIGYGYMDSIT